MESHRLAPDGLLFVDELHSMMQDSLSTGSDGTSFDLSHSSGTLHDRDSVIGDKPNLMFSWDDKSVVSVPSIFGTRRLCRSSRPSDLRLESSVSNTPQVSTWFDDSPTQSVFVADGTNSSLSYGVRVSEQQWFDESPIYASFVDRQSDGMSMFTFGPRSGKFPSPVSETHDSYTIVPTDGEADGESSGSSSSEDHLFDFLDEQLILAPIDSFAAVCWSAAITPERPESKLDTKAVEIRFSKLYSDTAKEYEEEQLHESSRLTAAPLPCMQFNSDATSNVASVEVAPWLYVSKKAASVLDLPQDVSPAPPTQLTKPSSRGIHHRHHRGQASLGSTIPPGLSIAGKCKRAINCIRGGQHISSRD